MAKLIRGVNDLATVNPELAKEWHPTKNGDLKPTDVTTNSNKKVWWLLPYDDPNTNKHFDFEWEATVTNRNKGRNCPYLVGKAVWQGFNDLATTNPKLVKEWHPIKNGKLKPENFVPGSAKKIWWLLSYDDPKTGKHFDFEWKDEIRNRVEGNGCPYLSGHRVWQGFNDLATVRPDIAAEWHPTKNGKLKPTDVMANSFQKVWWLYPYDDPKTEKHWDFEWQTSVQLRNRGYNCPFLSGQAVWSGFNDLATTNPKLAKEWHPTKNGSLKPTDITSGSSKKVWWLLPYDDPKTGKHFDFEWQEKISNRLHKRNCPYLSNHRVWKGYNDLATINPELAKEWHPTKNGSLKPTDVTSGSSKKVWWLLSYDDPKTGKHFNFEWQAYLSNRNKGNGCPYIAAPKNVILIQNLLQTKTITFIREKKYSNLKDKLYLPFDFYIYNNCIIEVDGPQHFKHVDYFGDKNDFKIRIKHDNVKNQYCADNNIPLLRIPYIYDPVADKEKIEQFVLDFIATGEVPQEIIDFYSQYKFSNYVACIKSRKLTEAA